MPCGIHRNTGILQPDIHRNNRQLLHSGRYIPFRICIDQYHLLVQFSGQLSVSFLIISQNDQTSTFHPSHIYYSFNFFPAYKHDEITFPFCFCLYGSDQLSHKGILQRLHSMGSGKSKHYSDDSGAMTWQHHRSHMWNIILFFQNAGNLIYGFLRHSLGISVDHIGNRSPAHPAISAISWSLII